MKERGRRLQRRLTLFLAVVGPGLITSNVNNEAGGIYTYSLAGAQFGFAVLWSLIPMAIALYVSEEMVARMGAITGKGLSDLIREEFGFRVTFFVMLAVLIVNQGNVLAEFAGVASAMEVFGVSKYISVPFAALLVWGVVLRGSAAKVERILMVGCLVYLSYVVSAVLIKPPWLVATLHLIPPPLMQQVPHVKQIITGIPFTPSYFLILAGLVGATIAPWQHFYLQAAVVEKRVSPRHYHETRTDVMVGSITSVMVVFFIIVCTASTLYTSGHRQVNDAGDAALALQPFGIWASYLFAFGLLNASLFAASVLPLSTAFVICEGLGFEAGVDRKFNEAPIFYWLYTALIVLGAAAILIPGAPLVLIAVTSQVLNGFLLPFILVFVLLLVNRKDLIGEHTNSRTFNLVAWVTSIAMILLTLGVVIAGFWTGQGLGLTLPH
ncbi:MAG: divalent metal cation transporter [Acidobacteria bacterium]|nr:divalent metal cation transporter [Acidobacteriota bacterium]